MPQLSSAGWQGRALVVGGGGIGRAVRRHLAERCPDLDVTLATRSPANDDEWPLDLESDDSLAALTERLCEASQPLRLVFNATGRLHGASIQPEKRLQQVQSTALVESFRINAAGPLLLAKAVEPALDRSQPFHFASLSARVGSIGDNRSGGWYAYRSSEGCTEHDVALPEFGMGTTVSAGNGDAAASRHHGHRLVQTVSKLCPQGAAVQSSTRCWSSD